MPPIRVLMPSIRSPNIMLAVIAVWPARAAPAAQLRPRTAPAAPVYATTAAAASWSNPTQFPPQPPVGLYFHPTPGIIPAFVLPGQRVATRTSLGQESVLRVCFSCCRMLLGLLIACFNYCRRPLLGLLSVCISCCRRPLGLLYVNKYTYTILLCIYT